MPSAAAKKASTCLRKCCSFSCIDSQSFMSCARSSSSAVQKLASAFLYIFQISGYWIGKSTNRFLFSMRIGSWRSSSCAAAALVAATMAVRGERAGRARGRTGAQGGGTCPAGELSADQTLVGGNLACELIARLVIN